MPDQWIVGYGSLMARASRTRQAPRAQSAFPVKVRGISVGWFHQFRKITQALSPPFLGAQQMESATCGGVIYKATQTDLNATDDLETGYTRVEVPADAIGAALLTRPSGRAESLAIALQQAPLPAYCAGATDHTLPLPTSLTPDAFHDRLLAFLQNTEYVKLNWCVDKGVRDTGPYVNGTYVLPDAAVRTGAERCGHAASPLFDVATRHDWHTDRKLEAPDRIQSCGCAGALGGYRGAAEGLRVKRPVASGLPSLPPAPI